MKFDSRTNIFGKPTSAVLLAALLLLLFLAGAASTAVVAQPAATTTAAAEGAAATTATSTAAAAAVISAPIVDRAGMPRAAANPLRSAASIAVAASGAFSGTPVAALAAYRGLAFFSLASCASSNVNQQPWLEGALSFPESLLPSVGFGAAKGRYHRAAVVAFLVLFLLGCIAAYWKLRSDRAQFTKEHSAWKEVVSSRRALCWEREQALRLRNDWRDAVRDEIMERKRLLLRQDDDPTKRDKDNDDEVSEPDLEEIDRCLPLDVPPVPPMPGPPVPPIVPPSLRIASIARFTVSPFIGFLAAACGALFTSDGDDPGDFVLAFLPLVLMVGAAIHLGSLLHGALHDDAIKCIRLVPSAVIPETLLVRGAEEVRKLQEVRARKLAASKAAEVEKQRMKAERQQRRQMLRKLYQERMRQERGDAYQPELEEQKGTECPDGYWDKDGVFHWYDEEDAKEFRSNKNKTMNRNAAHKQRTRREHEHERRHSDEEDPAGYGDFDRGRRHRRGSGAARITTTTTTSRHSRGAGGSSPRRSSRRSAAALEGPHLSEGGVEFYYDHTGEVCFLDADGFPYYVDQDGVSHYRESANNGSGQDEGEEAEDEEEEDNDDVENQQVAPVAAVRGPFTDEEGGGPDFYLDSEDQRCFLDAEGCVYYVDEEGVSYYPDEDDEEEEEEEQQQQQRPVRGPFTDDDGYAYYLDGNDETCFLDEEGHAFYVDENGVSYYRDAEEEDEGEGEGRRENDEENHQQRRKQPPALQPELLAQQGTPLASFSAFSLPSEKQQQQQQPRRLPPGIRGPFVDADGFDYFIDQDGQECYVDTEGRKYYVDDNGVSYFRNEDLEEYAQRQREHERQLRRHLRGGERGSSIGGSSSSSSSRGRVNDDDDADDGRRAGAAVAVRIPKYPRPLSTHERNRLRRERREERRAERKRQKEEEEETEQKQQQQQQQQEQLQGKNEKKEKKKRHRQRQPENELSASQEVCLHLMSVSARWWYMGDFVWDAPLASTNNRSIIASCLDIIEFSDGPWQDVNVRSMQRGPLTITTRARIATLHYIISLILTVICGFLQGWANGNGNRIEQCRGAKIAVSVVSLISIILQLWLKPIFVPFKNYCMVLLELLLCTVALAVLTSALDVRYEESVLPPEDASLSVYVSWPAMKHDGAVAFVEWMSLAAAIVVPVALCAATGVRAWYLYSGDCVVMSKLEAKFRGDMLKKEKEMDREMDRFARQAARRARALMRHRKSGATGIIQPNSSSRNNQSATASSAAGGESRSHHHASSRSPHSLDDGGASTRRNEEEDGCNGTTSSNSDSDSDSVSSAETDFDEYGDPVPRSTTALEQLGEQISALFDPNRLTRNRDAVPLDWGDIHEQLDDVLLSPTERRAKREENNKNKKKTREEEAEEQLRRQRREKYEYRRPVGEDELDFGNIEMMMHASLRGGDKDEKRKMWKQLDAERRLKQTLEQFQREQDRQNEEFAMWQNRYGDHEKYMRQQQQQQQNPRSAADLTEEFWNSSGNNNNRNNIDRGFVNPISGVQQHQQQQRYGAGGQQSSSFFASPPGEDYPAQVSPRDGGLEFEGDDERQSASLSSSAAAGSREKLLSLGLCREQLAELDKQQQQQQQQQQRVKKSNNNNNNNNNNKKAYVDDDDGSGKPRTGMGEQLFSEWLTEAQLPHRFLSSYLAQLQGKAGEDEWKRLAQERLQRAEAAAKAKAAAREKQLEAHLLGVLPPPVPRSVASADRVSSRAAASSVARHIKAVLKEPLPARPTLDKKTEKKVQKQLAKHNRRHRGEEGEPLAQTVHLRHKRVGAVNRLADDDDDDDDIEVDSEYLAAAARANKILLPRASPKPDTLSTWFSMVETETMKAEREMHLARIRAAQPGGTVEIRPSMVRPTTLVMDEKEMEKLLLFNAEKQRGKSSNNVNNKTQAKTATTASSARVKGNSNGVDDNDDDAEVDGTPPWAVPQRVVEQKSRERALRAAAASSSATATKSNSRAPAPPAVVIAPTRTPQPLLDDLDRLLSAPPKDRSAKKDNASATAAPAVASGSATPLVIVDGIDNNNNNNNNSAPPAASSFSSAPAAVNSTKRGPPVSDLERLLSSASGATIGSSPRSGRKKEFAPEKLQRKTNDLELLLTPKNARQEVLEKQRAAEPLQKIVLEQEQQKKNKLAAEQHQQKPSSLTVNALKHNAVLLDDDDDDVHIGSASEKMRRGHRIRSGGGVQQIASPKDLTDTQLERLLLGGGGSRSAMRNDNNEQQQKPRRGVAGAAAAVVAEPASSSVAKTLNSSTAAAAAVHQHTLTSSSDSANNLDDLVAQATAKKTQQQKQQQVSKAAAQQQQQQQQQEPPRQREQADAQKAPPPPLNRAQLASVRLDKRRHDQQQQHQQQLIQHTLEYHNSFRARHPHCPPLEWDEECARSAALCAAKCSSTNTMQHCFAQNQKSGAPQGQNIYFSSDRATVADACAAWYGEMSKPGYNFKREGGARLQPGTGHFTQMVWASAGRVGAAVSPCGRFLVCNYDGGNVLGKFRSNVRPPQ